MIDSALCKFCTQTVIGYIAEFMKMMFIKNPYSFKNYQARLEFSIPKDSNDLYIKL
ncbi:hypothetical protein WSI_04245 [Candidatus Liberibacter asiaticus str. gxpsy]|uniref:Uncharacterized protein n=2 Tax=Liberibacter asiaticus TaxID=34021 RepID=C6XGF3_LIBAP|nr:hypothetical protein CLIBASIA_04420 [Candidatus Liberibacter asiaticus str. psy62]AGH17219.1 hypothetical protein WSI_04245 [Candidatus Liberibacter asiaticus str. gxpsy]BAP26749.1 hypothetical protein CGUJ_04420 [Candidatus Liberibacter asiaticus str. Ishi-1]